MYCYTPKKRNKHKDTITLLISISIAFIIAFGIARIEKHPLVMTINNGNAYNPCELSTVTCGDEPSKEITQETPQTTTPEKEPLKTEIDALLQQYFGKNWKLARAVMMSEGKYDNNAFNPTNGSNDRGHFQISRKWHPEVSDECAKNSECNIKEASRISNGGTDWHEWVGYWSGSYKKYL